jgi:uncharacterized protein YqjF (DUF2071 family)
MNKVFLKAEWRKLILINYEVDPDKLLPYIPYGTELDYWKKKCYVSLVGFCFLNTKMMGIAIPFHRNFEEINLRFYVRYKENGGGHIDIKFQKSIDGFICIIQDNGIGRQKANEYKSQMHVEYQSKGMSLTAERINILNRQLIDPITIEINDLTDAQGQATGTRIILHFPYTINLKPVKNDTNRNYRR